MRIDYISTLPGMGKTKWAVQHLAHHIERGDGYYIYVAPSNELLLEVRNYLLLKLKTSAERAKIELLSSKTLDSKVVETIYARLEGRTSKFGYEKPAPPGTVFLITHEAFLLLPRIPGSNTIRLCFDEARKCVSQDSQVRLNLKTKQAVLSQFYAVEDGHFLLLQPKVSSTDFARLLKTLSLTAKQKHALKRLFQSVNNPRLSVYLSAKGTNNYLYEVVLPSRVFEGFKSVVLMSAFFEDSQMYYLLKRQGTDLNNITDVSVGSFSARFEALRSRYRNADLVSLFGQEHTPLSKTKLKSILVSVEHEEKILRALRLLDVRSLDALSDLKRVLTSDSVKTDLADKFSRAWAKTPDDIHLDPLAWMLEASKTLVAQWAKHHQVLDKPLFIMNAKARDKWSRTLKDVSVESTNLHGLNKYSGSNVVVFLAAVNPSPLLIQFFKHFLPGYKQEKDYIAEVCVQSICRTSLRSVDAQARILIIVPDNKIASLLNDKLLGALRLTSAYAPPKPMTFVVLQSSYPVRTVKTRLDPKARFAAWAQNPVNIVCHKLRIRASYYKKKNQLDKVQQLISEVQSIKASGQIPSHLLSLAKTKSRTVT